MELTVSPTRMQLLQLKRKLAIARRGHKLLKDKRDELMRQFMELVDSVKESRVEVESKLSQAMKCFLIARMQMSSSEIEASVLYPTCTFGFEATQSSSMGVTVPQFRRGDLGDDNSDTYPYGLAMTSAQLDTAVDSLAGVMPTLLELAEREKSAELLAEEIESTRRRVNALEYVLIPKLEETIKFITMKLDEVERGNLARLMKVKEMVREGGV